MTNTDLSSYLRKRLHYLQNNESYASAENTPEDCHKVPLIEDARLRPIFMTAIRLVNMGVAAERVYAMLQAALDYTLESWEKEGRPLHGSVGPVGKPGEPGAPHT